MVNRFHSFRKPKNQRSKRALDRKESKVHENDKVAMFIKGGAVSETVSQALKELVCKLLISA